MRCLNHQDPNGVSSALPIKPQFEETRTHAVTFRTPVEVQNGDWCALGQFWTAGALPQEYDMVLRSAQFASLLLRPRITKRPITSRLGGLATPTAACHLASTHSVSICQECFPDPCPHPPSMPAYSIPAACWWERVCTTGIQASVAPEMIPHGRAGRSGPGSNLCARTLSQITGTGHGPGAVRGENAGGAWQRVK